MLLFNRNIKHEMTSAVKIRLVVENISRGFPFEILKATSLKICKGLYPDVLYLAVDTVSKIVNVQYVGVSITFQPFRFYLSIRAYN
jgi:hypothetical protein